MHVLQGLEPGRVRRTVPITMHGSTQNVLMVVTTTMDMKMELASQGKQSIAGRTNCQSCASYKADYTRQFLTHEKDLRQISPFQHRTLEALRDARNSGGKSVMAVRVKLGKQSVSMKVEGVQVPNPTHNALAAELQGAPIGLSQLHSFLREPVELAALVEDGTLKAQTQQILLPRMPIEDVARLRLWYARIASGASIDDLRELSTELSGAGYILLPQHSNMAHMTGLSAAQRRLGTWHRPAADAMAMAKLSTTQTSDLLDRVVKNAVWQSQLIAIEDTATQICPDFLHMMLRCVGNVEASMKLHANRMLKRGPGGVPS